MDITYSHLEDSSDFFVVRTDESQCIKNMEFLPVPDEQCKKFFLKVRIETNLYILVYKDENIPVCYGFELISLLREKIINQKKIFDCMTLKIDEVQNLKIGFKPGLPEFKRYWN